MAVAVTLLGASVGTASATQPTESTNDVSCQEVSIPVGALPNITGTQHLSGQLCTPTGKQSDGVQVLVPGASLNHTYWNWPQEKYSYTDSAVKHGYSTLSIDRFNTGKSDRLPSALATDDVQAIAVHQAISGLRDGSIGGHAYPKVAVAGHSLGSIIVTHEQALFNDADAVLLTGFSNMVSTDLVGGLATGLAVPAQLASPRFADRPLGDVTISNLAKREEFFYNMDNMEPGVAEQDEATKDVFTAGELAEFPIPTLGVDTSLIKAPVMLANGSDDAVFYCGLGKCSDTETLRSFEEPRFTSAESFTPYVLPQAGHTMNLQRNAPDFFAAANSWMDEHLGGAAS